ncbi:MAG: RDD family protein [Proteobacteria bacterium]|nr:RDD family protein [Pseudomonadota bacterium]
MECPVCGQINADDASACFSCGQRLPSYMGGVSVDTSRSHPEDKPHMVIAGNIDFPLPPTRKPASPLPKSEPPLSARLPKPSLPKIDAETTAAPAEEAPSHAATSDEEDLFQIKPSRAPSPLSPIAPTSSAPALRAVPMSRPSHMIYAGFWYRFLAWLIDVIILSTAQSALGMIFMVVSMFFAFGGAHTDSDTPALGFFLGAYGVVVLLSIVLSLLYFTLCESSRWQATIGKLVIGLKVTDTSGNRLSFLRALGRYAAHFVTNLTLLIGYVINVFTARQQALHDLIAGTLVVYKEVAPLDLADHPVAPARTAQKVSAVVVWFMWALLTLSIVLVMGSLIKNIPDYHKPAAATKMYEAEMLGASATTAASEYQAAHGQFPPTLDAADFHQTSPQVRRIWIDADSGVIHLELAFSPLKKKTLDFVPSTDEDGDLIWACHSDDIDPQYLPEHCR